MKEPPFIPGEFVEKGDQGRIVETFVSEPLPYMGPVLLLDVGIVILVIAPGASKGNRLWSFRKVPHEMVVQEFGTVITIEPEQWKGE